MDFSRFFIEADLRGGAVDRDLRRADHDSNPADRQYPEVVPPSVVVRTVYPGANQVIAETVATPRRSDQRRRRHDVPEVGCRLGRRAANDRHLPPGTDPDAAAVKVQNAWRRRAAEDVRRQGRDCEAVANLPDGGAPDLAARQVRHPVPAQLRPPARQDALARIPGVGDAQIFGGGDYAMRAWLDPDKVASRGLTASDVVRAMREQNVQVSAGQLGAEPLPNSQFLTLINARGRLKSEKEFGDIVLKSGTDGEIVRLADVARLELGAGDYTPALAAGWQERGRYRYLPVARCECAGDS